MTEFEDMDPEAAAQFAQSAGEDVPGQGGMGQVADSGGSVLERLFDGSAEGPQVTELKHEYGLEQWSALVVRGVLRVAPGRGMPPIGDISLGGVMGVRKFQVEQQQESGDGVADLHDDVKEDVQEFEGEL